MSSDKICISNTHMGFYIYIETNNSIIKFYQKRSSYILFNKSFAWHAETKKWNKIVDIILNNIKNYELKININKLIKCRKKWKIYIPIIYTIFNISIKNKILLQLSIFQNNMIRGSKYIFISEYNISFYKKVNEIYYSISKFLNLPIDIIDLIFSYMCFSYMLGSHVNLSKILPGRSMHHMISPVAY